MVGRAAAGLLLVFLLVSLAGCKSENKFVAPPLPDISVVLPLKQSLVPFTEQAGNTQAFNTVDLVARVEGFLIKIGYQDGAFVKKSDLLFQIDPTTYIAQVVPLVTATGAGANSRISLGLCVFSGMIASTCLAVLFVPSFFTVMQRFEERRKPVKAKPATEAEPAV
jgi:multidrug efflux pump subunit AcrA (membrane-fusion protein)